MTTGGERGKQKPDVCVGCCRGVYQTIPVYGASVSINRTFSEGAQFVEYKVVDVAGNFARCSFYVTVRGGSLSAAIYTPKLPKLDLTTDAEYVGNYILRES